MTDQPWYSPGRQLPVREPRAGEPLNEFWRHSDHTEVRVELRDHGSYGVEAQIYMRSEFRFGQRFDTRALAVEWAEAERPETRERGVMEPNPVKTCPKCGEKVTGQYVPGGRKPPVVPTWQFTCSQGHQWSTVVGEPEEGE